MAGLVTAGKNLMLDSGFAPAYVSLHTADPGATGTSEVTGGSPAYARKTVSWGAAASGTRSNSTQVVFDVPSGTTISYLGYWSAVSAGTFYGSRALSANETFGGQGTYTIAIGDIDETVA